MPSKLNPFRSLALEMLRGPGAVDGPEPRPVTGRRDDVLVVGGQVAPPRLEIRYIGVDDRNGTVVGSETWRVELTSAKAQRLGVAPGITLCASPRLDGAVVQTFATVLGHVLRRIDVADPKAREQLAGVAVGLMPSPLLDPLGRRVWGFHVRGWALVEAGLPGEVSRAVLAHELAHAAGFEAEGETWAAAARWLDGSAAALYCLRREVAEIEQDTERRSRVDQSGTS